MEYSLWGSTRFKNVNVIFVVGLLLEKGNVLNIVNVQNKTIIMSINDG